MGQSIGIGVSGKFGVSGIGIGQFQPIPTDTLVIFSAILQFLWVFYLFGCLKLDSQMVSFLKFLPTEFFKLMTR